MPSEKVKKRAIRTTGPILNTVHIGEGMPSILELRAELDQMLSVLLGREEAPINRGVMTLMEVAEAYYARAGEIEILIHRGESTGVVAKNSQLYLFRTRELRAFQDVAKGAMELGSRRVTSAKLEYELESGAI